MAGGKTRSYEIDMCQGAILPKLLQFCVPLMCSSVLQLLFNAADVIVVGRFAGDNSLAAVGSTTSIINLMINLFVGISVGANILAARFYGAGERENLRQTVHTAMLLGMVSGAFLLTLGVSCAGIIMRLVKSPLEVRDLAALYLRIYFLGMPATMLFNFGSALLRAVGDTRRPLYYLIGSGVVNVCLNLLFVLVFRMDVAGVGLATAISQWISGGLVLRCMLRETGVVHLELRQLRFYRLRLKQILQVGLPAGIQAVLFAFSNVVIQTAVNTFDAVVVAGSAASSNVETFVYTAMNAFYQGTISFVSQNYGAGRYERLKPILWRAQACVITTGLVMGGGVVLVSSQLLGIYSTDPVVIAAGVERMRIICTFYFLCGIMDVMAGMMRGLGYAMTPLIVSLIGACGLRIIWIATVFQIPRFHRVTTVYWSYPISWILTSLAHVACFLWAWRRVRQQWKET